MRRVRRNDDGAVAVIVAVLAVALFGFAALVVDVGALYDERRQLQNGADGAALALAQTCAVGPCGSEADQRALAQPYANGNARDSAAHVAEICGSGHLDLKACDPDPASEICVSGRPDLIACKIDTTSVPGNGYVKVRTATGTSASSGKMPPLLARVLNPDYDGGTVEAAAVANWGIPGGAISALPFTFGNCEWQYYTDNGLTYDGPIVPPSWPGPEAIIYLTDGETLCPGSPPGGDSSGGFGWLGDDASKCTEASIVDGFMGNSTGLGTGASCDWTKLKNTTVHIPVFDCHTDTSAGVIDPDLTPGPPRTCHGEGAVPEKGTSTRYHIVGYAAFFLTGMNVPGSNIPSDVPGSPPCSKCISGYFTKGLLPATGPITSGTGFGSTVIGLAQ